MVGPLAKGTGCCHHKQQYSNPTGPSGLKHAGLMMGCGWWMVEDDEARSTASFHLLSPFSLNPFLSRHPLSVFDTVSISVPQKPAMEMTMCWQYSNQSEVGSWNMEYERQSWNMDYLVHAGIIPINFC